ncbi:MAG: type VI secretion system protein TssL, long form [Yersinia sp. (in: enterobacteria)]
MNEHSMSNNGQEADATLLVPTPGGRQPSASELSALAESVPVQTITPTAPLLRLPGRGLNRLVRAANPLLGLIVPLRTTTQPPDIEDLRQQLAQAVHTFENEARKAGIDLESIAGARYALCTVLDETIAGTAWGSGVWGSRGLLVAFHNESSGGEKFFLILQRLSQDVRSNIDLLELFYLCLALGMEGRYRLIDRNQEHLSQLRERLQQLIATQRGSYEPALSPHWRGASIETSSPLRRIPLWVLATGSAVVLGALHIGYSTRLAELSDPVYGGLYQLHMHMTPPAQLPRIAVPVTPPPVGPMRMAGFLAAEIAAGKVTVTETGDRSIIGINGDGMFGPGSAELTPAFVGLIKRIGDALNDRPGKVLVIGHTDSSKPGVSARFPSNYELSKARAISVMTLLEQQAGPADRFSAEGRGDSEPLVPNDTAADRMRNRRVEITLLSPVVAQ